MRIYRCNGGAYRIFAETRGFGERKTKHLQNSLNSVYKKLFNGKWEKDFETYISDHFPARNFFASTDSYYMLYSGRNGSNGVYKGKDGYIINTPVKCDEEKLNANITAMNNFVKNTGDRNKTYCCTVNGIYNVGRTSESS